MFDFTATTSLRATRGRKGLQLRSSMPCIYIKLDHIRWFLIIIHQSVIIRRVLLISRPIKQKRFNFVCFVDFNTQIKTLQK